MKLKEENHIEVKPSKFEELLNLAQDLGYQIAVYDMPPTGVQIGYGRSEKMENVELQLLKQWVYDNFIIWCWVEPTSNLKFTGYSKYQGEDRPVKERHASEFSYKDALLITIREELRRLKTII